MSTARNVVMAGLLALATVPLAHADEMLATQQGATVLGGAAAGVVLGGPLGMLAGSGAGCLVQRAVGTGGAG